MINRKIQRGEENVANGFNRKQNSLIYNKKIEDFLAIERDL